MCAEVTVAWRRPVTIPATSARRGAGGRGGPGGGGGAGAAPRHERAAWVEPHDDGGKQPVEPEARCRVDVERGRRGGEDRGQAGPHAGERECRAHETRDRQADE